MSWCTVESDPGVFTELIKSLGVKGVQVEELYDLELSNLLRLQPVYGLIFLFKWRADDLPSEIDGRQLLSSAEVGSHLFFAKQVVNNACATQALISVLLNRPEIDLGPELSAFKSFTEGLPPDLRGEAIGSSESIRAAHNSFARPEPFIYEEKKAEEGEGEDAFHFISYVPVTGQLYELDGLKSGPISLGVIEDESKGHEWLDKAREAIQKRVQKYTEKEIRFNLLAIVKDRTQVYQQQLAEIANNRARVQQALDSINAATAMDTSSSDSAAATTPPISIDPSSFLSSSSAPSSSVPLSLASAASSLTPLPPVLPTDPSLLSGLLNSLASDEADVRRLLVEEEQKHERWESENIRRRHNYVPFVFHLLKMLAEKGKLTGMVEAAALVTAERNARMAMRKAEKKKEIKDIKAAETKEGKQPAS